ncbi:lipase family protein [Nocardia sp. CDC153]|uniref:lipase family protein n=1 Tax=Nocardia sp. CDC153 TaxID=3112167 RepID=UPI002DB78DB0|nr:lipase family protein [Nocardia sp. CDC153]MEC3956757.1 lipase family protein [Nocardia sp. CDC153]
MTANTNRFDEAAVGAGHAGAFGPGRLLAAEPMTARMLPGLRLPARAWRISYATTTAKGDPTQVTGTVLVPDTPWRGPGSRPLVGYAVGTQGMANTVAAASWQLRLGIEYESVFLRTALRRGWALAIADYPGLGSPGLHPYVMGRALGPAVLDSMRAARRLPEAELDPDGPLGIYGYSEGGNAAGWALQLQPTYAPDLPLVGGAVGSAPADLVDMVKFLDDTPYAVLLFYGVLGIEAAYPELNVLQHLNVTGRVLAALARRTHAGVAAVIGIGAGMIVPTKVSTYTHRPPFEVPEVKARLLENRLGGIAPAAPVLVAGGTSEQIIPYPQAVRLAEEWKALGADVTMHTMKNREHIGGALAFAGPGMRFLAERFADSVAMPLRRGA